MKDKDCCLNCKFYMSKYKNDGYCMRWSKSPVSVFNASDSCCNEHHNPENEVRYEQAIFF